MRTKFFQLLLIKALTLIKVRISFSYIHVINPLLNMTFKEFPEFQRELSFIKMFLYTLCSLLHNALNNSKVQSKHDGEYSEYRKISQLLRFHHR